MAGDVLDRRGRKKLANRDALREAGLKLFLEKGYAATSLQDITDAADLGLRTFYRHFETKEDLLLVEVRQYLADVEEVLEACPADLPPMDCFFRVIDELAPRWAGASGFTDGLFGPLYQLGEAEPAIIARFHWVVDQHVNRVMQLFAERLGVDPWTMEPRLLAYLSRVAFSAALFLSAKGKESGSYFEIGEEILARFGSGIDPDAVKRRQRRTATRHRPNG